VEKDSVHNPIGSFARRSFLMAGIVGGGGATAVAGYEARKFKNHAEERAFYRRAGAIIEKHGQQNTEIVAALKRKYENPVFGKARVWDLIEKLGMCIDETDATLFCASQFVHVQQVLEGMENDSIHDHDLLIAALVHDVGKVLLLNDELPENVVGVTGRINEAPHGAGLDQLVFQFGHGEMIYSRMKDHVPEHLAWLLRYHGTYLEDVQPFLSDRDQHYWNRYLVPFRKYDNGTKSYMHLPRIDLAKYRALIEETFPQPILF